MVFSGRDGTGAVCNGVRRTVEIGARDDSDGRTGEQGKGDDNDGSDNGEEEQGSGGDDKSDGSSAATFCAGSLLSLDRPQSTSSLRQHM